MSVSASLADFGSIATTRATPAPKPRTAPAGGGQDDAFGQMLREAARERPEAPARDGDRFADRGRAEEAHPEEARATERPAREKPELPRAALDHRSENARRGGGPRDPGEVRRNEGRQETGQVGKAGDGKDAAQADCTSVAESPAEEAKPSDPAAPPSAAPATSPAAPVQQATTAETLQLVAFAPVANNASPATDAVVEAAGAPGEASVTQPVAGTTTATPVPPAIAAKEAQLLAEAAPALLAGETPDAAPGETGPDGADGKPGVPAGKLDVTADKPALAALADKLAALGEPAAPASDKEGPVLPEKAAEAVAAARLKQAAHQPGENGKALGHARQAMDAEQAASAPAPSSNPVASATLEALRAAPTEGQPQANTPAGAGPVQAAALTPAGDARMPNPAQALQRHEMPVPMQAVAIEIGMRAMRGAKEFAIRLDPEDLGRIDVKLEVSEAGQVQAKVVVEKVETLQLLQRDARTLERAFDQAGLKTTPDGLQFTLRDPGGQGRNGGDQPSRSRSAGGSTADEPVIDEIRLQPAQYRLAANGGLDIRI